MAHSQASKGSASGIRSVVDWGVRDLDSGGSVDFVAFCPNAGVDAEAADVAIDCPEGRGESRIVTFAEDLRKPA